MSEYRDLTFPIIAYVIGVCAGTIAALEDWGWVIFSSALALAGLASIMWLTIGVDDEEK